MLQRWMSHGIAFALGAAGTALVFVAKAPVAAPQPPVSPPAALARTPDPAPVPRVAPADGAATQGDDGAAAIRAMLESKRVKGLQWEDQNLDQVITYLRTVTGLNFFITPRVRNEKFDEVKVTLGPLDDISVRQILDLVTAPYDLTWEAKAGIVQISMK